MIKVYKSVLTESPLDSPFVPKEKRWVAAAAAAAAAIFDGIMNTSNGNKVLNSQEEMNQQNIDMMREANEKNIALQKETNAQNYRMFQEQNAFNLDMWNKQNDYNSPKKQVERLLAAGINPATGLGQVSQASSLSSSQAIGATAPHVDAPRNYFEARQMPLSQLADGTQAAINAFNQSQLAKAETKHKEALSHNTEIDSMFKVRSMEDTLKHLHNEAQGSGWSADLARRQLEFYEATMEYEKMMKFGDYQMQLKSMERLQKEIDYQELQYEILQITKAYAPEMNRAQIAQLWSTVRQANAQIGLINANTLLTYEQREHEIAKKIGTVIENGMKGIDKRIKMATEKTIIQNELNRGEMIDFERRNQKSGERFRRFQSLIPFTSAYAAKVLF